MASTGLSTGPDRAGDRDRLPRARLEGIRRSRAVRVSRGGAAQEDFMTEQRAQLVPVDASVIAIRGNLTESGYVPPEDLKRHEWEAAGQSFRSVERASRFWIGDWVSAGERMYGVTYKRAAELTGREESDIRSMASVSGRVP